MTIKKKIFLTIITLVLVIAIIFAVKLAIYEIFKNCGDCGRPPIETPNTNLDDPNLFYASIFWAGLCGNAKHEMGGCYSELYLYSTGKLVKESGWVVSNGKREDDPVIEKTINATTLKQITKKITDAKLLEKDCPRSQIMDAGWEYHVKLTGRDNIFYNPPSACQDTFDEVDKIINAITDTK